MADGEFFLDGDLDMIDVVAIPDRLEHAIGEAKDENVLDGFLAEIMIDPVDLMLVGDLEQLAIEGFGRREIGAERLLDHQPAPRAMLFAQQPDAAELFCDRRKGGRRDGKIEQAIAARSLFCLELFKRLAQGVE